MLVVECQRLPPLVARWALYGRPDAIALQFSCLWLEKSAQCDAFIDDVRGGGVGYNCVAFGAFGAYGA